MDLRHTQCEQKTNTGENTTCVKFKNWQNYGDKSQDNDGVGMLLTGKGREEALWGAGTLSMSIWVAVTGVNMEKSNLSFTHSTYASPHKEICHLPTLPPAIAHCVDDSGHRSKDCVIPPAPPVPGT